MSNRKVVSGIALAAAAAALFSTGVGIGNAADSGVVQVKCYGANSCKGQAECKTAMNECKGHNACKGQGFVNMSERACLERFGRQ